MPEWTPGAREYLAGYLGQVSALARHQGDDAEEIVAELRDHIEREAEASGGPLVTVDLLRAVLAGLGTPDQIAGVEAPSKGRTKSRRRCATTCSGCGKATSTGHRFHRL